MRVILRENVESLGKTGDVVNVSDGYARNYLLPRGAVVKADPRNLARVEHEKKVYEAKRKAERATAEELAKSLSERACVIARRVGEDDSKLFGSVTAADIAAELRKHGLGVEKRHIHLKDHIKTLGIHEVRVRIQPDVESVIRVSVVKEAN